MRISDEEFLSQTTFFIIDFENQYKGKIDRNNLFDSIQDLIEQRYETEITTLKIEREKTLYLNDKTTTKFLEYKEEIMILKD